MRRNLIVLRLTVLGVAALLAVVSSYGWTEAATITVDTASDTVADDGQCSLREAITSANTDTASGATTGECPAGSGADTITLPTDTYTLAISGASEDSNATGDLDITADLTINGGGASTTVIDGGAIDRVFHVGSGATVQINDVTITNGSTVSGQSGGGIDNRGTLVLTDTTVSNNTAASNAGGIYNFLSTLTINNSTVKDNSATFDGVGVFNVGGTLTISDSTIFGNTGRNGGGIKNDNNGSLTVTDSTISGNSTGTGDTGGGIWNDATITMTGSTVSDNSAGSGGGIFTNSGTISLTNSTFSDNSGGGVRADTNGTVNLANTIIANSTSGADCLGAGTFTSNGYNLDRDGTCSLSATGDITASSVLLGALADNGGPTKTHALQSGSPAIDAGNPATPGTGGNACDSDDQRGTTRPQGSACDIGAYELVSAAAVPGLTGWGLIALASLLAIVFAWRLRRRTAAAI